MADRNRGVTLIEILIGILIMVVASIGTLNYFAYARGGVGKQGNRRAALEQARQRLEELMAVPISQVQPAVNKALAQNNQPLYWIACGGGACSAPTAAYVPETVSVDNLPAQRIESTVQWRDDAAAGTTTPDALELTVKVWFTQNINADDDFNRVHVRTLRAP